MVTREDIVVEVRKVPEKYLDELFQIIKDFCQILFRLLGADDGKHWVISCEAAVSSGLERVSLSRLVVQPSLGRLPPCR